VHGRKARRAVTDKYRRDGTPYPEGNAGLFEWAHDLETLDRQVAWTRLSDGKIVSTVWEGLDHRLRGTGPPLIFETAVFAEHKEPFVSAGEVQLVRTCLRPAAGARKPT